MNSRTHELTTCSLVLIGFGKELYDEAQEGNTFDWHDLLADVAGAVVGACMAI